jgi:hypothetical protein
MRKLALLLAALCGLPAAAEAQRCAGQAPWSSGAMKVGGSLEFGNGVTDILGGIGFGKDKGMFVHAEGGVVTGHGDTGFEVGGGLGWEMKKPITDKVELCPIVNAHASFGYFDTSEQTILGGATAGYPLNMQGNVGVTLTGGLQLGFDHFSISDCPSTVDCSSSDFVGQLDAGAGFIFNNRITLLPLLVIPINNGDLRFFIGVNVAIGRK